MAAHGPPDCDKLDNPIGKIRFVTDLCNAIRDDIIAMVRHMPPEWDGIELREFVADEASRERTFGLFTVGTGDPYAKNRKRYQDYESAKYNLPRR